jgi:AcrR family transcriptional regulator
LADSGAEAVTISSLCEYLGVTKGSFYYHFYNMPEFVEAFVEHWEANFSSAMLEHLLADDPLDQMGGIMTTIANLSHEAEAALRAWGHSNPVIGSAQERIDQTGEDLVAAIVGRLLDDPEQVALLAHQAVALSIGLQHRVRPIDRVRYLRAISNLAELTCGVRAHITETPNGPVVKFVRRDGL